MNAWLELWHQAEGFFVTLGWFVLIVGGGFFLFTWLPCMLAGKWIPDWLHKPRS